MKKILKIQNRVKKILTDYPKTRSDDMLLYLKVVEQIDTEYTQNVLSMSFEQVLPNLAEYHLPSIETVGRTRRRLQALYPELRATDEVQDLRSEREVVFKEYSKVVEQ